MADGHHLAGIRTMPKLDSPLLTRVVGVGVETVDSRTGGFLPQPGGSLRQSLTAGAPWRAQTARREACRTWPEVCVLRRSCLRLIPMTVRNATKRHGGYVPHASGARRAVLGSNAVKERIEELTFGGSSTRKKREGGSTAGMAHRGAKCHRPLSYSANNAKFL